MYIEKSGEEPIMAKKLVFVIDMQNDFISGSLGTPEARAILTRVVARLDRVLAEGAALIFTRDTHYEDYLNTQEGKNLPVPHCVKGTPGHELARELLPFASGALVVDKPAFGSAALPRLVEPLVEEDTQFLFLGLCTDICVISNALLLKAHYPENTMAVAADCCAGVTPQSHQAALTAMGMCQISML